MTAESTPKFFLHIGAPKTGTTFLQKFFSENQVALRNANWLYPDVSLRGFGHHDLAFLTSGGYPAWANPQPRPLSELRAALERTVKDHRGCVLVSSENFYLLQQPHGIYDLLEKIGISRSHSIKVIVYLRRQDAAHESWYNQTIKAQGYTHTLASCLTEFDKLWDYDLQLSRWATIFGKVNLIVRRYNEIEDSNNELISDFLPIMGLSKSGFHLPECNVNISLNRDILEFQRIVNQLPLPVRDKRRFHKQLIALTEKSKQSSLFNQNPVIEPKLRKQILDRYEDGNARVARDYFNEDRLFPHPPEANASSVSYDTPEGLTAEKIVSILVWLLARNP